MRRMLTAITLTAACVALGPPGVYAQGSLDWGKGPTAGLEDNKGTISASGRFKGSSFWTPDKVTLYAVSTRNGGTIYSNDPAATILNGQWSAKITNVPPGSYTVWASLPVEQAEGGNTVYLTAGVGSVTVGGAAQTPAAGGSISYSIGPRGVEEAAGGVGKYAVDAAWQFADGTKPAEPPLNQFVIPGGPGRISSSGIQNPASGTWALTTSAPPGTDYTVLAVIRVKLKAGGKPQLIGTRVTTGITVLQKARG
jgi:hypothetical protein